MFFDDIIFNISDNYYLSDNKLYGCSEGFMYGNMFKDEYRPYKNYKVSKLEGTNDKGDLLLKIYQYDFALNDLSLYLDLYPNDKNIYETFKLYTEKLHECVSEYERKYGPMELDNSNYNSYKWFEGVWPFIGGEV